jgi:hypothetical protein
MQLRRARVIISLLLGLVICLCLVAPASAAVAGYNGRSAFDIWGHQVPGYYGVRSDVFVPTPLPAINHPNTIKACVAITYPGSAGVTTYARSGWQTLPGQQQAYRYWEGLDQNYNPFGGVEGAYLPRTSWANYQVKKAQAESVWAYAFWGPTVKAYWLYMGTDAVVIASGQIRAGGTNNDIRSKWRNCEILRFMGPFWVFMRWQLQDPIPLGPQYGQQALTESFGPADHEFRAWNIYWGEPY